MLEALWINRGTGFEERALRTHGAPPAASSFLALIVDIFELSFRAHERLLKLLGAFSAKVKDLEYACPTIQTNDVIW